MARLYPNLNHADLKNKINLEFAIDIKDLAVIPKESEQCPTIQADGEFGRDSTD